MKIRTFAWLFAVLLAVMASGCAYEQIFSDPALKESRRLLDAGQTEQALALLQKAMTDRPENLVYRSEFFKQRDLAVTRWLAQAEALLLAGQLEGAYELYKRVQKYDSANARARGGIAQIEAEARHRRLIVEAEKLVRDSKFREAEDVLRPVLVENPQNREARRLQRAIEEKTVKPAIATPRLTASALKPLTLELRDVPLRTIFDVISRAIGVNFVFDKDVRTDQRTGLAIQDTPAEEVIRLILATNQLEQKIINDRTMLIFPNTPQKLREHQELVVKSFYLANADVRQTANMVRTLVKTRDIFIDEKLNLLIIKDTPNAVRLAERLIAAQDLAEPEVMLEVEVLEVAVNKLLDLGIRWPDTLAVSLLGGVLPVTGGNPAAAGTPGTIRLPEWLNRSSEMVQLSFTNPLFAITLRQQDGSTSVLANPRIRVKNKGKAKVHIGNRVPVITTTAAATGGFVSENVSYLDVGLKLEVEPLIHLEDEVAINVGLEVSNIIREVTSRAGSTSATNTLAYEIGTRNANTVLRLRDGETQVLAGLISDADRRTANRVPGIGEFPVVGRLFSATNDRTEKSEIVLLITPRLVRTLARPDVRTLEFAAGTEASTGAGVAGVVPSLTPPTPPRPFTPPVAPPPAAPGTPGQPSLLVPQPGFPSGTPPASPAPTPFMPGTPGAAPGIPPAPPSPPITPPGQLVPFGGVQQPPR
jgi:general secretion pathway protein D